MKEALGKTLYWFACHIDQTAVALQTMPLWLVVGLGLITVNIMSEE